MKFSAFVATAALFFGLSANAMMDPKGTFVPTECGVQTGFVGHVHTVCIGMIVGEQGRQVQFKLNDNTMKTFKVVDQQNMLVALMSGNTKSMLFLEGPNGEKASMKVIQTPAGEITSAQGQVDDAGFFVPKFEDMVSVQ